MLKSSFLPQMALDYLQVVCQPTRIRGNLLAHVFATWDMVVSANVSSRLFAAGDWVKPSDHTQAQLPIDVQLVLPACFRVISANVSCRLFAASDGAKSSVFLWAKLSIGVQLDLPTRFRVVSANISFGGQFVASDEVRSSVHVWAKLANCVQLIWPAHFWVNLYNALEWVNCYATHLWVNSYNTHLWVNLYATHMWVNQSTCPYVNMHCTFKWVDQCASCQWEKQYVTPQWVHNNVILPTHFWVYNLPQFKGSDVSVWRDSTAHYNVADRPFFVLHPKPIDCSSFGETFKIYAHHLLQYRLVCVIEFVFHWSNHWCHFISKHACMLVNLDLTPQQHCRRAHLTMCQSQYYKHDFAIMSSASDVQINYTVVSFVKYLENIIQCTFQLKHIYKISVRYSTKDKIRTNNSFDFSEQNVTRKIGGGKHVEKIKMDVISAFIVNAPPNASDIEMCEFIDHLETSECLKKYQSSDHILCNVPLHDLINYLFEPNRIFIGNKHGVHFRKNMTKFEITNLFKNHDDVCKHEYLTVFRTYTQISSSTRKSNYCKKLQQSQLNDISDSKLPESMGVVPSEFNNFPPDVPDASLRRKIIGDF